MKHFNRTNHSYFEIFQYWMNSKYSKQIIRPEEIYSMTNNAIHIGIYVNVMKRKHTAKKRHKFLKTKYGESISNVKKNVYYQIMHSNCIRFSLLFRLYFIFLWSFALVCFAPKLFRKKRQKGRKKKCLHNT